MITAVNSINNNQNYVNFEGRKFKAKKVKKAFKKLPYKLGMKKTFWERLIGKKTLFEKISDFFTRKTRTVKKNSKVVLTETEPEKDGLFKVLAKDFAKRVKRTDEILNS